MTTAQERKQQERQARRRRIQRAAREVFAEKGYAKTSIEQIARHASLSVGAIYLYFRSKEDLYISLLEETLEWFEVELGQIRTRPDLDASRRLHAAWEFLTRWATSDVEGTRVLRLVAQPGVRKQLSEEVVEAAAKGVESIREHLTALIEAAMNAGVYRHGDARATADVLWSLFLGTMLTGDARSNLSLPAANFAASAELAFCAVESSLRTTAAPAARAA